MSRTSLYLFILAIIALCVVGFFSARETDIHDTSRFTVTDVTNGLHVVKDEFTGREYLWDAWHGGVCAISGFQR